MNDILSKVYFNNTVQDYLIALAIIVGGIIVLSLFKRVILLTLKEMVGQHGNRNRQFSR